MPKMTYLTIKKNTLLQKYSNISTGNFARKSQTFVPTQRKGKINGHPGFDHLPDMYTYILGYKKMSYNIAKVDSSTKEK